MTPAHEGSFSLMQVNLIRAVTNALGAVHVAPHSELGTVGTLTSSRWKHGRHLRFGTGPFAAPFSGPIRDQWIDQHADATSALISAADPSPWFDLAPGSHEDLHWEMPPVARLGTHGYALLVLGRSPAVTEEFGQPWRIVDMDSGRRLRFRSASWPGYLSGTRFWIEPDRADGMSWTPELGDRVVEVLEGLGAGFRAHSHDGRVAATFNPRHGHGAAQIVFVRAGNVAAISGEACLRPDMGGSTFLVDRTFPGFEEVGGVSGHVERASLEEITGGYVWPEKDGGYRAWSTWSHNLMPYWGQNYPTREEARLAVAEAAAHACLPQGQHVWSALADLIDRGSGSTSAAPILRAMGLAALDPEDDRTMYPTETARSLHPYLPTGEAGR